MAAKELQRPKRMFASRVCCELRARSLSLRYDLVHPPERSTGFHSTFVLKVPRFLELPGAHTVKDALALGTGLALFEDPIDEEKEGG